ncbi:MAG: DNA replication and repair protein RecF [Candidatus Marinimicrobia bacterium]|nr:DNA replication and repair protein RecF [Candidatus Neomarinimicrobiota bacterium]MCF7829127.1 DNA replication and repair protein RecF [Candidatus Neomarinimicrobiota bacterium]MCF7881474.1 DNA replication and repair protein RecF [Candidatus Neomarinimicrobiota bacterium]
MTQFRNYDRQTAEFSPAMNILYGPNGSGKTTVLEAIHCLAVAKSFKTHYDRHLVQHNTDFYQLEGEFSNDNKTDLIQLNYMPNKGKKLFINKAEQDKLSIVVGRYPVVTLTPEDGEITTGPPAVRRKYINKMMSQASSDHMENLIQLGKVLDQRNAILQDAADSNAGKVDETLISVYDDQLITEAAKIEKARQEFFENFRALFQTVYESLNGLERSVQIRFSPSVAYENDDQFDSEFREALDRRRNQELAFRRTMVGPQSDVIDLYMDGNSLREYGSQGEHKIILIGLKLAEGRYIANAKNQSPIYLFDDLFAELDIQRSQRILSALDDRGQMLITSTDLSDVRQHGIDISGEGIKVFDMEEFKSQGAAA